MTIKSLYMGCVRQIDNPGRHTRLRECYNIVGLIKKYILLKRKYTELKASRELKGEIIEVQSISHYAPIHYVCSLCGKRVGTNVNYCPNCGGEFYDN